MSDKVARAREHVWNEHVPNSAHIPAEMVTSFNEIKAGIAQSVAYKDNPAIKFWINRLKWYV